MKNTTGGDSKKYAVKVFSILFTVEKMADGIVQPSRANLSGTATLDQEIVDLSKYSYLCKCVLVFLFFFGFSVFIL